MFIHKIRRNMCAYMYLVKIYCNPQNDGKVNPYTRSHVDGINTPPAKMAYFCSIFSGASKNAIWWCAKTRSENQPPPKWDANCLCVHFFPKRIGTLCSSPSKEYCTGTGWKGTMLKFWCWRWNMLTPATQIFKVFPCIYIYISISINMYTYIYIYKNIQQDMPSVCLEKRMWGEKGGLFRTQMAYDRRSVDAIKLWPPILTVAIFLCWHLFADCGR